MAHIGKIWRLHNRRDTCLANRNHRTSWPAAMSCDFNLRSGVADPIFYVASDIRCLTSGDPWSDQLTWASEEYTQHGRTFYFLQRFSRWDFDLQLNFYWQEVYSGETLVLAKEFSLSGGVCAPFVQGAGSWTDGVFIHPTFWGTSPFVNFYNIQPVTWPME